MAFAVHLSFMILKTHTSLSTTSTTVGDQLSPTACVLINRAANTVLTLADWYDRSSIEVAASVPPVYQATLVNGMGRNFANPGNSPLAVVKVTKGLRYRFRIVNMACDPGYTFSIDGHSLTVIEADGENTKPLLVDSLQIFAGQRYSVILNANQKADNYWIRAVSNTATPAFDPNSADSFAGGINSAILRYAGARSVDPTTSLQPRKNILDQNILQPLTNPAAPGPPDANHPDVHKINLDIQFVSHRTCR
jgi:iron transport multicopper oxidase